VVQLTALKRLGVQGRLSSVCRLLPSSNRRGWESAMTVVLVVVAGLKAPMALLRSCEAVRIYVSEFATETHCRIVRSNARIEPGSILAHPGASAAARPRRSAAPRRGGNAGQSHRAPARVAARAEAINRKTKAGTIPAPSPGWRRSGSSFAGRAAPPCSAGEQVTPIGSALAGEEGQGVFSLLSLAPRRSYPSLPTWASPPPRGRPSKAHH
jgi:hypothetical protein